MKNRNKFWNNEIEYIYSNIPLDIININDNLIEVISNEDNIKIIINNIIKSKFYIFNKNKTNIFIDVKVFLYSVSFLFGFKQENALIYFKYIQYNDEEKYRDLLKKIYILFKNEDLVSDKYSDFQPIPLYLGKNNVRYFSNSFIFTINLFHNFFRHEITDTIISFPYLNNFKFLGIYNNIIKDSNFQVQLIKNYEIFKIDYFD